MEAPTATRSDAAKRAYRFDNTDLVANRAGHLSDRQASTLWRAARLAGGAYLGAVLVALIQPLRPAFRITEANRERIAEVMILLGVVGTVGSVVAVALWWWRYGHVLRSRQVRVVSGPVTVGDRKITITGTDASVQLPLLERTADVWRDADSATVCYTMRGASTMVHSVELPAIDSSSPPPLAPEPGLGPVGSEPLVSIEAIQRRFQFTDEDLECNRAGRLSPAQISWHRARSQKWLSRILIVGGSAVLIFTVLAGADGSSLVDWGNVGLALLLAGGFLLLLPLWLWWHTWLRPLRRGPRKATGPVTVSANGRSARVGGGFNGALIRLQPGDHEMFVEGDVLTVYCSAAKQIAVLSIEPGSATDRVDAKPVSRYAWMIIPGLAVALVTVVLFGTVSIFLALRPGPDSIVLSQPAVGACFTMPDVPYGSLMFWNDPRGVRVDCSEPHLGQVIGRSGSGESCDDFFDRFEEAHGASVRVDQYFAHRGNCIITQADAGLTGSYVDGE